MNEASILIEFRRGSRFSLPNEEIAMPKSSISRRIPSPSRSGTAVRAAARRSISARSAISRQRDEAGSCASAIAWVILPLRPGSASRRSLMFTETVKFWPSGISSLQRAACRQACRST